MGRFVGFAVVGASGLVVNQVALWFLTSKVGVYYLLSAVVATQISTIWNFALVERFVFDGGHDGPLGATRVVRVDEQHLAPAAHARSSMC